MEVVLVKFFIKDYYMNEYDTFIDFLYNELPDGIDFQVQHEEEPPRSSESGMPSSTRDRDQQELQGRSDPIQKV